MCTRCGRDCRPSLRKSPLLPLSATSTVSTKAGNGKLQPELLATFQKFASQKVGHENQLFFVFHGESGSEKHDIATALGAGVVKMNVDTHWA